VGEPLSVVESPLIAQERLVFELKKKREELISSLKKAAEEHKSSENRALGLLQLLGEVGSPTIELISAHPPQKKEENSALSNSSLLPASNSKSTPAGAPQQFEETASGALQENSIPKLALQVASQLWENGTGLLPPGWDWEDTPEGPIFLDAQGVKRLEDPRKNFASYVAAFVAAAKEGCDLNNLY